MEQSPVYPPVAQWLSGFKPRPPWLEDRIWRRRFEPFNHIYQSVRCGSAAGAGLKSLLFSLAKRSMKKNSSFLLAFCCFMVINGCGPDNTVTVSPVDDSKLHSEEQMEEMAAQNASDMQSK